MIRKSYHRNHIQAGRTRLSARASRWQPSSVSSALILATDSRNATTSVGVEKKKLPG
jgi:hypothetical protein